MEKREEFPCPNCGNVNFLVWSNPDEPDRTVPCISCYAEEWEGQTEPLVDVQGNPIMKKTIVVAGVDGQGQLTYAEREVPMVKQLEPLLRTQGVKFKCVRGQGVRRYESPTRPEEMQAVVARAIAAGKDPDAELVDLRDFMTSLAEV